MSYVIEGFCHTLRSLPMGEVLRYMRGDRNDPELIGLVESLLPRFMQQLGCKACYIEVPVRISGTLVDLDVLSVDSGHLAKNLKDCDRAILFAATIGAGADRLKRIAEVGSSVDALALDAMGSAAVEALCDALCAELACRYSERSLHPRFSPGYGDLALEYQRDVLRILDAQRKIGLTLTDSLLMIPQKSVTAIVGLEHRKH